MFRRVAIAATIAVVLLILSGGAVPVKAIARAATQTNAVAALHIKLEPYVDGFGTPVGIVNAGDNRMFVVEKVGRILIVRDGRILDTSFLDIGTIVNSDSTERGLLGLAFPPDYAKSGLFYIYYTAMDDSITIARYKVSENPDVADPTTAQILLTQKHPRVNHNGGQLQFGPDGYLYAGLGDGGGGGDPDRNGQNPKTLLGKLLRIDVNIDVDAVGQGSKPYGIPKDNPFASGSIGAPEVWDFGLRNPWRFSFDRKTQDLYIGDVGQGMYEEIDVQKAGTPGGLNFGWNQTEGSHCYTDGCAMTKYVAPIFDYDHSNGCSVVGGYVYRGSQYPDLDGVYFFSDFCGGAVWGTRQNADGSWDTAKLLESSGAISTFGEDANGELYLADLGSRSIRALVEGSS